MIRQSARQRQISHRVGTGADLGDPEPMLALGQCGNVGLGQLKVDAARLIGPQTISLASPRLACRRILPILEVVGFESDPLPLSRQFRHGHPARAVLFLQLDHQTIRAGPAFGQKSQQVMLRAKQLRDRRGEIALPTGEILARETKARCIAGALRYDLPRSTAPGVAGGPRPIASTLRRDCQRLVLGARTSFGY